MMAQTKKASAAKKSGQSSPKMDDMRTKTDDQLTADLGELKRESFNLRFQAATNQLERPARLQGERARAAAK
jgi:large subunit ribosomal protein L29